MKRGVLKSLLAFSMLSAASVAPPPLVLEPNGPWKILQAPDECQLSRAFGTNRDPVFLRFARGSGLDSFDTIVAARAVPPVGQKANVRLRALPDGPLQEYSGWPSGFLGRNLNFVSWFDGDPEFLNAVGKSEQIELKINKRYTATIHAAKAGAAINGLNACHKRLLKTWGMDVAALDQLSVMPKPLGNPADWLKRSEYARRALSRGLGSTTVALLGIDQEGNVKNCTLAVTSGDKSLDDASCNLLRISGKYSGARDKAGAPVSSQAIYRVRWLNGVINSAL